MPTVVGVAFDAVGKVYYFDPAEFRDLKAGERVIVETSRGRTLGSVVTPPHEVPQSELAGALKPVVRRATPWDLVRQDQMAHKEAETLAICRQRAQALGLPMKIVKVSHNFDSSSLVVYFTAEQRVDFRTLVHDLGQALQTRIEMRQVGVRDEAKFIGGYGRCGRNLCCASWLREFSPVSIKMAKQQDLPLNSPEVSGICGRLLCCLSYENSFYAGARKRMPRLNSVIATPQGPGKVKQLHILRNAVTVEVDGPSETKVMVEVQLPSPEVDADAGGGPCEECPAGPLAATDQVPMGDTDDRAEEPATAELSQSRSRRPRSRRRRSRTAGRKADKSGQP